MDCLCNRHTVITVDVQQRSLLYYPENEWLVIMEKLNKMPCWNDSVRYLQSLLVGYAVDVRISENGSMVISLYLRKIVGIDQNCIAVGQANKLTL